MMDKNVDAFTLHDPLLPHRLEQKAGVWKFGPRVTFDNSDTKNPTSVRISYQWYNRKKSNQSLSKGIKSKSNKAKKAKIAL